MLELGLFQGRVPSACPQQLQAHPWSSWYKFDYVTRSCLCTNPCFRATYGIVGYPAGNIARSVWAEPDRYEPDLVWWVQHWRRCRQGLRLQFDI